LNTIEALEQEFRGIEAPHTHELVRLNETKAMLLAAQFILRASLLRTESRLSHFRDDFPHRDDANWLVWLDIVPGAAGPEWRRTPIPTPLCPVVSRAVRPTRLKD